MFSLLIGVLLASKSKPKSCLSCTVPVPSLIKVAAKIRAVCSFQFLSHFMFRNVIYLCICPSFLSLSMPALRVSRMPAFCTQLSARFDPERSLFGQFKWNGLPCNMKGVLCGCGVISGWKFEATSARPLTCNINHVPPCRAVINGGLLATRSPN